jgi:hypothetical protein
MNEHIQNDYPRYLDEEYIRLELNSTGYRGNDIEKIWPHFANERKTFIGLTWEPSIAGPESYTLLIVVTFIASQFFQGFISELSKDLYKWAKSKLLPFFKKKEQPDGALIIVIGKITLNYLIEEQTDYLVDIFHQLPTLLSGIDINKKKDYEVEYNEKEKKWSILEEEDIK